MNDHLGQRLGEERLSSILDRVASGAIHVPTFQRPLSLTDDWMRSLLASVSLGYPIGAVVLLTANSREYEIPSRAVAGAPQTPAKPADLLVDGQHRIGALFQALVSDSGVVVQHEEGEARRKYWIDVRAAVDPGIDRDDAVVSKPADTANETSSEFPLGLAFGPEAERQAWRASFLGGGRGDEPTVLRHFEDTVLAVIERYLLPVIHLEESLTRWTIRVRAGALGAVLSEELRARAGSPQDDPK